MRSLVKINLSVPAATVAPVLVYSGCTRRVAFLTGAFGFVERARWRQRVRPSA